MDTMATLPRILQHLGRLILHIGLVVATVATGALAAGSALAQTETNAASGITVTGYGEASAPAETVDLQILITRDQSFAGPPPPPRPGDVPGDEERAIAAPIVDALVAAGVDEAAVEVVVSPIFGQFYGPNGPIVARLDLTIESPELEQLTSLISAASVAAADQDVFVGQVGVDYQVADCAALERQAREAAISDARARAAVQAELLGLTLGDVIGSADAPAGLLPSVNFYGLPISAGGCAPPLPTTSFDAVGVGVTLPGFDPTVSPAVEVYAQVALTFGVSS